MALKSHKVRSRDESEGEMVSSTRRHRNRKLSDLSKKIQRRKSGQKKKSSLSLGTLFKNISTMAANETRKHPMPSEKDINNSLWG
jgi:hypothetical protein